MWSEGIPEVTIHPSTLTTQEGGNLTLTCLVTGAPAPTLRWRTEHLQSSWNLQVHDTAFRSGRCQGSNQWKLTNVINHVLE